MIGALRKHPPLSLRTVRAHPPWKLARSLLTLAEGGWLFTCLLSIVFALVLVSPTCAQPDEQPVTREEANSCLDRAVKYIVSRQHESGCFSDSRDRYKGSRAKWEQAIREGRYQPHRHSTALTSLTILSLASLGHQPSDPTAEGRAMAKAIDYIMDGQVVDRRGYYGCLLYTSPSPRDATLSRMPSSA